MIHTECFMSGDPYKGAERTAGVRATQWQTWYPDDKYITNKANLRDLIAATGLVISNWIQIVDFQPVWPWNLIDDLKKKKKNRALLLYYVKLCASFQIHRWIQTGVTVRKRSEIQVEIGNILARVTMKFDAWPWKIIRHLLYTTSSFLYHFKAMGEFKLELQSGNALFGSKSANVFVTCGIEIWRMTFKNNRHLSYTASSFVHHFINISEFKLELQSGNAQFGSNSTIFLAVWPWNLTDHLEKQLATSSFVHHFIAMCEFKLELRSENGQVGSWLLWPWPLISDLDLLHGRHVCQW